MDTPSKKADTTNDTDMDITEAPSIEQYDEPSVEFLVEPTEVIVTDEDQANETR